MHSPACPWPRLRGCGADTLRRQRPSADAYDDAEASREVELGALAAELECGDAIGARAFDGGVERAEPFAHGAARVAVLRRPHAPGTMSHIPTYHPPRASLAHAPIIPKT